MLGLEGHVGLSKTCLVPAGLGDYVRLQKVQGPPLSRHHHGILRGWLFTVSGLSHGSEPSGQLRQANGNLGGFGGLGVSGPRSVDTSSGRLARGPGLALPPHCLALASIIIASSHRIMNHYAL